MAIVFLGTFGFDLLCTHVSKFKLRFVVVPMSTKKEKGHELAIGGGKSFARIQ
ncbi:unnamed protein product [Sphenostylis stenocarpa]|uniref:Uncharacterized protein n=1 Tax=Sphenostylis stenocarpa TaxID=92480 RepID=A0AA86RT87_9FABA|nr:unnamed protein product [Sphenostylis stenocarpa]